MRPGGILTYDLGQHVGWAYGHSTDNRPEFGGLLLPKWGGEGGRFAAFENEVADHVSLFKPKHIRMAAPLHHMAGNSRESVQQQLGLRAIVLSEAYRGSASAGEIDEYQARLEVLGTGRFAKGEAKAAVVRWCKTQDWHPGTHDQGDALVIWEYFRRRLKTD